MTDTTVKRDGELAPAQYRGLMEPWKPGQSGNPAGRPKGARNKLAEAFIEDLAKHWEMHGQAALAAALKSDPAAYVRVVASLLPRDFMVAVDVVEIKRIERVIIDERPSIAPDGDNGNHRNDTPRLVR